MRITDLGEDEQQSSGFVKKNNILENIKTQSRITDGQPIESSVDSGKITADVQSNKLKELLGQLKPQ
jgi:hypothetical protein